VTEAEEKAAGIQRLQNNMRNAGNTNRTKYRKWLKNKSDQRKARLNPTNPGEFNKS